MKQVFVINGPARSGKDTFVRIVRELLSQYDVLVYSRSSIFPVKKYMVEQNMWDGVSEKTEKNRTWMVKIKQLMTEGRIHGWTRPNQYLINEIASVEENAVVFVHIREPENIDCFKVLCERMLGITPQVIHILRVSEADGTFETGVDLAEQTSQYTYEHDFIINQDGLDRLEEFVRTEFVEQLFPDLQFDKVSESSFENLDHHKPYDDEMAYGVI